MIIGCAIILPISAHFVLATTNSYTEAEVAQHNTSSSCWVIYENNVYDITTYLNIHNQRYQNITSWCGTDMTTDFDNVRKHEGSATTLLETFKIGALTSTTTTSTSTNTTDTSSDTATTQATTETDTTTQTVTTTNPYNLLFPLILATVLYWGSLIILKNNIKKFNGFWNTILLLTFVIPSLGFGIIMMLQYQYPSLANINFRFLYWHVELSVFMGALAVFHFLRRMKIYFLQVKTT